MNINLNNTDNNDYVRGYKDGKKAGATEWAGKAKPVVDALIKIASHTIECGCVPCVGQCRTAEALQMEIDGLKEIAFNALAKYKEVGNDKETTQGNS
jgi:hypothetical protein